MNITLLTTNTTHHQYFAYQINQQFPLQSIITETEILVPPFDTNHPSDDLRDEYEKQFLLQNHSIKFTDITKTHIYNSINDKDCISTINELKPDVLIIFGTRKLTPAIIQIPHKACMNLHGGNPEKYRGLDTHLWAIYHNDFDNLVTTLHHVDSRLDTGDIILKSKLEFIADTKLYQIRAINTMLCTKLVSLALTSLNDIGWLPSHKQTQKGRYYSFMPGSIKDICIKKFERYTSKL